MQKSFSLEFFICFVFTSGVKKTAHSAWTLFAFYQVEEHKDLETIFETVCCLQQFNAF